MSIVEHHLDMVSYMETMLGKLTSLGELRMSHLTRRPMMPNPGIE